MPLRVLIVDDCQDVADSLAMVLRLSGHDVQVAYDGPAALTTFGDFAPDAVVLDIAMPGMDGWSVARTMRKHEMAANVMIVIMSGHCQDEDRRRSMLAGCDHHLAKPFDPSELERLLQTRREAAG